MRYPCRSNQCALGSGPHPQIASQQASKQKPPVGVRQDVMCALRRQGIPDSFNPDQFGMEQQKRAGATATLERPTERKSDLGKDYRVLLFNDESNTREFVTEVLMKYIPVRTPLPLPSEEATPETVVGTRPGIWLK